MFQRLVFTAATAISLTGLYALYSVAMRPIVVIPPPEEPRIESQNYTEAQRPSENVRIAAKYIPANRWQKDREVTESKYMLRADQAFVYTDEWKSVEGNNKSVEFKPFAMVWVSTDKDGNEQAFSVVSERAQVEFASAFDLKNPSPGRVVGGVLHGAVDIAGPDGLAINGTQFYFTEEGLNLFTPHPVNFRFQSSQGHANKMSMKLIRAEGLPGMDRPHVFGVESIHLSGGPNPTNPKNIYVNLEMQIPQGQESRKVNARCTGDLSYTVATSTAVLREGVIVWTGMKPFDKLECDQLTMQFSPKKGASIEGNADSQSPNKSSQPFGPEYQKIDTNLEFKWLKAEGRVVKIVSPSNQVVARMRQFTYSDETRTISMSSEKSGENVIVTRNGSTLVSPRIDTQLDEQKKELLSLNCRGAGKLTYFNEEAGRLELEATWEKQLSKITDEKTKLDLLELDGKAQFVQKFRKTGLGAELIRIWLEPMKLSLPSTDGGGSKQTKSPEPKPKRLLAARDVRLKNPQLNVERANELEVVFDDDNDSQNVPTVGRSRSRLQPASMKLSDLSSTNRSTSSNDPKDSERLFPIKAGSVVFASVPASPLGSLGPPVDIPIDMPVSKGKQTSRVPPTEPLLVSADRIGVRVRRLIGTPEPAVREVHSEGKVQITQKRKPGEKPLSLEGDRVDLQTESETQAVVHVQGKPALIRDRGFEIEGKDIHLDRGANRAWVVGSGKLSLPLPADSKIPGLENDSNRDLVVSWIESMNFNGLDAEFQGAIEAKLSLAKMKCGQMVVQLVNPVSFQSETIDVEPAIKKISCNENVKFENMTYKDRKTIDVYRGHVGNFEYNYVTGEVKAQGPGEIIAWKRKMKDGGFTARETIQANRPIPTETATWDYTQVQFEGRLTGRFDGQGTKQQTRQRAMIEDRVEVVYGPVNGSTEKINPDKLPSMAGNLRCDKLQVVNYPESERNAVEYRELVGYGNAEIEGKVDGRRFTASADEISFDESKDLYILRGHGKRSARVTGIGSGNWAGQRAQFSPKLNSFSGTGSVEGQGSQ